MVFRLVFRLGFRLRAKNAANSVVFARPTTRLARSATVKDQQVREHAPLVAREQSHEIALDHRSGLGARESKSFGEPFDVRVDHDTDVDAKRVAKDDVRGLASDTAQFEQMLELRRHFAAMFSNQRRAGCVKCFRLGTEKPNRTDVRFDRFRRGFREMRGRWKCRKERGCRAVHRDIGALRGEDRCKQQFEWILRVQLAAGIWVLRAQCAKQFRCPRLREGGLLGECKRQRRERCSG